MSDLLKWAQLDLARQAESMEFIREFIDFLADNNYNGLFLYCEWRIGTKSFAGPVTRETYSADDMRSIVGYAKERGVDVIPGLAVLGHTELFLERPEHEEFAELRNGASGRFSKARHVLCPTHPQIRRVLADYLREMADIFPSQFMHIGGDEVWDMVFCERCRKQYPDYAAEGRLYGEHMAWCADFVIRELNRTPVMWDDMWEYYPESLELMPRQTIMSNWQYQLDMRGQRGHFLNRKHADWLKRYDELGFSYMMAPADYYSSNARTFYDYAQSGKNFKGVLFTSWEKAALFMYRSMPRFAYLTEYIKSPGSDAFRRVALKLFGIDDEAFTHALALYCEAQGPRSCYATATTYLSDSEFGRAFGEEASRNLCCAIFKKARPDVATDIGRKILDDMLLQYQSHHAAFRAQNYILSLCRAPRMSEAEGDQAFDELCEARDRALTLWREFRGALDDKRMREDYQQSIDQFVSLRTHLKSQATLMIRFMLPEKYSAYWTKLTLYFTDGSSIEVADSVFKPAGNQEEAFWDRYFPVDCQGRKPQSLEIEGVGFGGIGIGYAELRAGQTTYAVSAVKHAEGTVETPHYALDNDCKWAFLGCRDTAKCFHDRATANEKSKLVFLLDSRLQNSLQR